MLKKTIEFEDLDGNKVTEDFYFNLSKAEIGELELSRKGGLSEYLETVIKSEDGGEIMKMFKEIIGMSVGERSEDNRRFIKNEEVRNNFMQSDAYSVLFMELCTDAEAAARFIQGIIPKDLRETGQPVTDLKAVPNPEPSWIAEGRVPTADELKGATAEQMQEAFRRQAAAKQ